MTRKPPKAPLHNAPNSDKMPPLDTPPVEGVFYEIVVKTFRQNAFFSWKKERKYGIIEP